MTNLDRNQIAQQLHAVYVILDELRWQLSEVQVLCLAEHAAAEERWQMLHRKMTALKMLLPDPHRHTPQSPPFVGHVSGKEERHDGV